MVEDFEGKRLCPLMDLARVVAVGASKGRASVTVKAIQCKGGSCSWWDADKVRGVRCIGPICQAWDAKSGHCKARAQKQ